MDWGGCSQTLQGLCSSARCLKPLRADVCRVRNCIYNIACWRGLLCKKAEEVVTSADPRTMPHRTPSSPLLLVEADAPVGGISI